MRGVHTNRKPSRTRSGCEMTCEISRKPSISLLTHVPLKYTGGERQSRLIRSKCMRVPRMPCSCIAATFSRVKPAAYTIKRISEMFSVSLSLVSTANIKRTNRIKKLDRVT